ncbi:class I tRNA ligase family protein, partial [Candidatus Uhrbacteria bacterium]|nr:class I tRNA ligase family protein [Candidatus Uhrbacteria bacterium]
WVARMILMTTYALDEVPFRTVYLHGLVRDEQGRKMSKSLGNVIDPLDMVEKYGADAVRLSLVLGTGPGNDLKLSEAKIAGFRNFTNKLWNIARYVLIIGGHSEQPEQSEGSLAEASDKSPLAGDSPLSLRMTDGETMPKTLADQWILQELDRVTVEATQLLEHYEFSAAGELLREFTWGSFADWYLEISKWQTANGQWSEGTKTILSHGLERLLKLWHPFMPFVTEVVWEQLGEKREKRKENRALLMVEDWPVVEAREDEEVTRRFKILQDIVGALRKARADYRLEPAKKIEALIVAGQETAWLSEERELVQHLARLGTIRVEEQGKQPPNSQALPAGAAQIFISF